MWSCSVLATEKSSRNVRTDRRPGFHDVTWSLLRLTFFQVGAGWVMLYRTRNRDGTQVLSFAAKLE